MPVVEHIAALFIGTDGEVVGAYRHTDNQEKSCTFDTPQIVREARQVKAAGVWSAHNHCRRAVSTLCCAFLT